jgi:hypothetical protein
MAGVFGASAEAAQDMQAAGSEPSAAVTRISAGLLECAEQKVIIDMEGCL